MLTLGSLQRLARAYGVVTALLGLLFVVYNALWIGHPEPPVPTPVWLVLFQLSWGVVSFSAIFLYSNVQRSPVLPALYVAYTAATFTYVWYLGATRGTVLDEMVPTWWKVVAAAVGLVYLVEGGRQARAGGINPLSDESRRP